MKCPVCVREGKKSVLYEGFMSSTCGAVQNFYDEEGRSHFHNPNANCSNFNCSNGHQLSYVRASRCGVPGCEFGKGSRDIVWYYPKGATQGMEVAENLDV